MALLQTQAPKCCESLGMGNWSMRCHDLLLFPEHKSLHPMQQYATVPMDSSGNTFWPATRLAHVQYGSDALQHNIPTNAAIANPSEPPRVFPGFSHRGEFVSQRRPFHGPSVQHPTLHIPQLHPTPVFRRSSGPQTQLPPSARLHVQANAHRLDGDVDSKPLCKSSEPNGDVKSNHGNAQGSSDKTSSSPDNCLEVPLDSESDIDLGEAPPLVKHHHASVLWKSLWEILRLFCLTPCKASGICEPFMLKA